MDNTDEREINGYEISGSRINQSETNDNTYSHKMGKKELAKGIYFS